MKVLILSCNTGEGHNSAGKAIAEQFEDNGIYCEMKDALSFASERVSKIVCNLYINISLHTPKLFGWVYSAGEAISSPKFRSPVYYANKEYAFALGEYINENGFDTIICPHLFPCEALTALKRKNKLSANIYAVSTDYSCCPFFEEVAVNHYFIPHDDLTNEFAERGIPYRQLIPTGIPVSKKFLEKTDKHEARNILGLPQEPKIVIIMTGSMGFGQIEKMVLQLNQKAPDLGIVVLAGNNEELKQSLRNQFNGNSLVSIVDFTKQVSLYMDACDVIFTKPGGLSSTEAAVKNIPIIHTKPIPGCETQNAVFYEKKGLSIIGKDIDTAIESAIEICYNDKKYQAMKKAQQKEINPYAAEDIFNFVLENAKVNHYG